MKPSQVVVLLLAACRPARAGDPDEHTLRAALAPEDAAVPIASDDCSTGSGRHSLKLRHSVAEGDYRLRVRLVDKAGNVLDEKSTLLRVVAGPFDEDDSLSIPKDRG